MDIIQENGPLPPSPIQSPTRIGTNVSGMTERLLGSPGMLRRGSSLDSHGIPATFEAGSSWSGSSTPDRVKLQQGVAHTSSASATPNQPQSMAANVNVAWLAAIREWKNCLDALSKALQISLAETYKQYEANASPERIDQLFNDKRFRRHSIEAMRNASVYKMLSASPDFVSFILILRNRNLTKLTYNSGPNTRFASGTTKESRRTCLRLGRFFRQANPAYRLIEEFEKSPLTLEEMQFSSFPTLLVMDSQCFGFVFHHTCWPQHLQYSRGCSPIIQTRSIWEMMKRMS